MQEFNLSSSETTGGMIYDGEFLSQVQPPPGGPESVRPDQRGLLLKFPKHPPLADALIQVLLAAWTHFTDGDTEAQRDQGI